MEMKGYVLGSPPPVRESSWVPNTSVGPRLAPFAPSFLPSLPMDWAEVGHNGDQGVCFGVPTTCGGKFWGAHHLCWAKACSLYSQLTPSLPMDQAKVGCNGDWGVCFGVPTTCGGKFLGAHHLCWVKAHSPHSPCSQLAPLAPSLLPMAKTR